MKNAKVLFLIMTVLLPLISCKNQNKSEQHDQLQGSELNFEGHEYLLKGDENLNILFFFNGSCSSCIVDLVDWLKEWNDNESERKTVCFILSRSRDLLEVEYHLDNFNVKLKENQLLYADIDDMFFKNNPQLNPYTNVILYDNKGKIITSLNPFNSDEARKKYKKYNVLK